MCTQAHIFKICGLILVQTIQNVAHERTGQELTWFLFKLNRIKHCDLASKTNELIQIIFIKKL